ncbi:MAG: PASTA domain-containing protein [Acidimicrobiia bacterium]|nr:PASTA domain-containing protein [Acidimicrobiia bacterium]
MGRPDAAVGTPEARPSRRAARRTTRRERRQHQRRAEGRRKGRLGRWVAIVLVLAAVATVGVLAAEVLSRPTRYDVPDFVGESETEVRASIDEAGRSWVLNSTLTRQEGTEAGEVLAQEPPGGDKLADGSVINLVVSEGEPLEVVPVGLEGQPLEVVAAALAELELTVAGPPEQRFDEAVAAGSVLALPEAGQEVERGGAVAVVVSAGPEPRVVPPVAGQPADQVQAALADLGLAVAPGEEYSETVPVGMVVRTDPPEGSTLARGAPVTVLVSLGRQPIAVPNLIGLLPGAAFDELEALGLVPVLDGQPNRPVIGTSPIAGETLYRGDAVSVVSR